MCRWLENRKCITNASIKIYIWQMYFAWFWPTTGQMYSRNALTRQNTVWQLCFLIDETLRIFIEASWDTFYRASIHYAVRRLTTRSREVSKPRDSCLDFSNRSEIWQPSRQQCCRDACQISERYDHINTQSHGFETSRDLTVRRLTA